MHLWSYTQTFAKTIDFLDYGPTFNAPWQISVDQQLSGEQSMSDLLVGTQEMHQ